MARLRHALLRAAKEKGVYKGRPKTIDVDEIRRLLADGVGATEVARRLAASAQVNRCDSSGWMSTSTTRPGNGPDTCWTAPRAASATTSLGATSAERLLEMGRTVVVAPSAGAATRPSARRASSPDRCRAR